MSVTAAGPAGVAPVTPANVGAVVSTAGVTDFTTTFVSLFPAGSSARTATEYVVPELRDVR